MEDGWRFRALSAFGTLVLTVIAVLIGNQEIVLHTLATFPVLHRLSITPATGERLIFQTLTTSIVVLVFFFPMYTPTSRRTIETVEGAVRRIGLVVVFLATLGYFDYTYRIPRLTLIGVVSILFILLPTWFLVIRGPPILDEQWLLVGDDPAVLTEVYESYESKQFVGFVATSSSSTLEETRSVADGGTIQIDETDEQPKTPPIPKLGGMSRLSDIISNRDVSTLVVAFSEDGRGAMFDTIRRGRERGIPVKAHRKHMRKVPDGGGETDLVDVDPKESITSFMK